MTRDLIELMRTETQYVIWENYGTEGWKPKCYSNLQTALTDQKFQSELILMKRIKINVTEE